MKKWSLALVALNIFGGQAFSAELVKLDGRQELLQNRLKLKQSSALLKEIKKNAGHIRYQQLINGIPVYGYHVIHHEKTNRYSGHWIAIDNHDLQNINKRSEQIDANSALSIAKNHFNTQKKSLAPAEFHFQNESSKLYYVLDENHELTAAYLVSFFADSQQGGQPARPFYLINAQNKSIIRHWDGLTTEKLAKGPGGNLRTGRYEYGVDFPMLDVSVKSDNTTCAMSNDQVQTINLNHAETGSKIFEFTCPYHSNDDEINGAYSALNDAHFFGSVIYSMYQDWYNIKPLSFKLVMKVHYGHGFENAFWNGESMIFGDGQDYFYPLVALDVTAHEISHGVTEQNSNLEYWGQSGGLNESFSDMAGKAAEFYLRGENKWTIGEDISKSGLPLRSMNRPERDGNSIGDARDFVPSMDVHYTSGVFNRLFTNLSTTKGWNTRKAFEVMLNANMHYWEPETQFEDAAEGVIQAAADLNYNINDVINAARTVGIDCEEAAEVYSCRIGHD